MNVLMARHFARSAVVFRCEIVPSVRNEFCLLGDLKQGGTGQLKLEKSVRMIQYWEVYVNMALEHSNVIGDINLI